MKISQKIFSSVKTKIYNKAIYPHNGFTLKKKFSFEFKQFISTTPIQSQLLNKALTRQAYTSRSHPATPPQPHPPPHSPPSPQPVSKSSTRPTQPNTPISWSSPTTTSTSSTTSSTPGLCPTSSGSSTSVTPT